ncbi:hypothetical protein CBOM_00215 [Ceraceosorus bombacis]|uniref:Uncharacterized protein n=1 Tax=Ceraceosorus bombacis TaxID=401625 RepID=A0A0P1B8G0_9BASI|nr:hypothetical protein CBOM_00215 [Ceraceosorus bombacis]
MRLTSHTPHSSAADFKVGKPKPVQSKALTGWTPPAPTFHSGAGATKKFSRRTSDGVADESVPSALKWPSDASTFIKNPFSPLSARARASMDNWSFYSTDMESDGGANAASRAGESLVSPKSHTPRTAAVKASRRSVGPQIKRAAIPPALQLALDTVPRQARLPAKSGFDDSSDEEGVEEVQEITFRDTRYDSHDGSSSPFDALRSAGRFFRHADIASGDAPSPRRKSKSLSLSFNVGHKRRQSRNATPKLARASMDDDDMVSVPMTPNSAPKTAPCMQHGRTTSTSLQQKTNAANASPSAQPSTPVSIRDLKRALASSRAEASSTPLPTFASALVGSSPQARSPALQGASTAIKTIDQPSDKLRIVAPPPSAPLPAIPRVDGQRGSGSPAPFSDMLDRPPSPIDPWLSPIQTPSSFSTHAAPPAFSTPSSSDGIVSRPSPSNRKQQSHSRIYPSTLQVVEAPRSKMPAPLRLAFDPKRRPKAHLQHRTPAVQSISQGQPRTFGTPTSAMLCTPLARSPTRLGAATVGAGLLKDWPGDDEVDLKLTPAPSRMTLGKQKPAQQVAHAGHQPSLRRKLSAGQQQLTAKVTRRLANAPKVASTQSSPAASLRSLASYDRPLPPTPVIDASTIEADLLMPPLVYTSSSASLSTSSLDSTLSKASFQAKRTEGLLIALGIGSEKLEDDGKYVKVKDAPAFYSETLDDEELCEDLKPTPVVAEHMEKELEYAQALRGDRLRDFKFGGNTISSRGSTCQSNSLKPLLLVRSANQTSTTAPRSSSQSRTWRPSHAGTGINSSSSVGSVGIRYNKPDDYTSLTLRERRLSRYAFAASQAGLPFRSANSSVVDVASVADQDRGHSRSVSQQEPRQWARSRSDSLESCVQSDISSTAFHTRHPFGLLRNEGEGSAWISSESLNAQSPASSLKPLPLVPADVVHDAHKPDSEVMMGRSSSHAQIGAPNYRNALSEEEDDQDGPIMFDVSTSPIMGQRNSLRPSCSDSSIVEQYTSEMHHAEDGMDSLGLRMCQVRDESAQSQRVRFNTRALTSSTRRRLCEAYKKHKKAAPSNVSSVQTEDE